MFYENNAKMDDDVFILGWIKWKSALVVLCDGHTPWQLNDNSFYRIGITFLMLDDTACPATNTVKENKFSRNEKTQDQVQQNRYQKLY